MALQTVYKHFIVNSLLDCFNPLCLVNSYSENIIILELEPSHLIAS